MTNIVFASTALLRDAAAPTVGEVFVIESPSRVYQAVLSGAGEAIVAIDVSLNGTDFIELAAITLSTTTPSDGFASAAPWRFVRARVVSLVGGAVTVFAGV